MAKPSSQTDSRRMYSWWWDSHISPKNSKWLQENLTDMDTKVKAMIKLLEEDADSFARRAEMYYKKRPELMKLVEEFYRAYRALAERYDHATGVIRHAHRTMAEAFPNQVPSMFADDISPASLVSGAADPRTPETPTLLCQEDDMQNVGSHAVQQNQDYIDESDSVARTKVLKFFSDSYGPVEEVRRGLDFDEAGEKEQNMSEEIVLLKEALMKLEAEKEAGLVKYQESLDKLSQVESEVARIWEDFRVVSDHATKADNEVVVLKKELSRLEAENESRLQDCQECLDRISSLQSITSAAEGDAKKLNEMETEAQSLKGELTKLAVEKDEALNQYMESLDKISHLENKLRLTEEDAGRLKERAETAESEVEIFKQTIVKLTEGKEADALQYQKCLEMISSLERKLMEETKWLHFEIDSGASKLKCAEENCLLLERSNRSLHSQLESLMLKMGTQTQELTEKQEELGRLWACIQEERLRFLEAETAFQTLQHLHAQTQEELQSMASELQNRAQLLKVVEACNQSLLDEVVKAKEESKQLDQLNASAALSIKDMQNETSSLKESKGRLEEEIGLRLDERNALQQEIYCLKEELNDLNKKHLLVLDQMESLGSSVKELWVENSNLKETCHRESSDKGALLEKLEILDQLVEKNSVLDATISDLNTELEAVRQKIETLEQSCQSLSKEKSTLMNLLEEKDKNLVKVSESNTVLANSLSDAQYQLEALKDKSKMLEDSCQFLMNEKARIISERDGLNSQLENTQTRLEELGKVHGELEMRFITLEKEKEFTLLKVEELQMSLEVERQLLSSYIQTSKIQFSCVEAEMQCLQEECQWRERELDHALDNAIENEIEIFVLRIMAKELEENSCSLLIKNWKLSEESSLSEKKISLLEKNNCKQEVEIKSLSHQVSILRAGTSQLLRFFDIVEDHAFRDRTEQDQICFNQLLSKLQNKKESLCKAEEEHQRWAVEFSILLGWIKQQSLERHNLEVEKNNIEHEFKIRTEQFLVLQRENFEISKEKRSLMDNFLQLEENNHVLEEENYVLCDKVLVLENLSLIYRSCAVENFMALRELGNDLNKLHAMNAALMGKLSLMERTLEESKAENLHLDKRLQKSEDQLKEAAIANDQLSNEIENGKNLLHQMVIELQETETKISLMEKEKLEFDKRVENLRNEYNEVKKDQDCQENQILKLAADRRIEEQNFHFELQKKVKELNNLETQAASIFGQLQYSTISLLLYEQKYHEIHEACLGYMDQNQTLKTQMAAYGPEIMSLNKCISSLENHTDIYLKFRNPENEAELQGAQVANDPTTSILNEEKKALEPGTFSDLCDLRDRLKKIEIQVKELIIQENMDLRSKLDASMRQLELLQSEPHMRNVKPTSETLETEIALKTKDIVLDQMMCEGFSQRDPVETDNQNIDADQDGESKKIPPSTIKNTGHHTTEALVDISKGSNDPLQEENKRKVLERLDSDVQKLANLQTTIQELKRKLDVAEKGKRGKGAVDCEALKGQLEEADAAMVELFDLNGRLMKSIEDSSFSDEKSLFDMKAGKMSENIGKLELEVQKLETAVLKFDDEKQGKTQVSDTTKRTLLRDYLHGRGRIGSRRKRTPFCACIKPSTIDD